MKLAEDLWPAVADPAQLESAMANLAINARDAMPGGGVLTIETANMYLDDQYASENTEVEPGWRTRRTCVRSWCASPSTSAIG